MSKSPLEHRVHGLSASDLEAISREMYANNYEPHSQDDIVMYWYMGSRLYLTLLESAFRYACIEADYLQRKPGTKSWLLLHNEAKTKMWKAMYEAFPDLETRDFSTIELTPYTDEQMRQHVEQKHRPNSNGLGLGPAA
jgi:hypothetical protein